MRQLRAQSLTAPGHCRTCWRWSLLTLALLTGCSLESRASLGRFAEPDPGGAGDSATVSMPDPPDSLGTGGTRSTPVGQNPRDAAQPPGMGGDHDAGTRPDGMPTADSPCARATYVADLMFTCPPLPMGRERRPSETPPGPMPARMIFGVVPSPLDPRVGYIVDSAFMFVALDVDISGHLTGQLNCTTGAFHADIADGTVGLPFGPRIPAVGELSGMLDRDRETLAGTWWHGPLDGFACTGTWAASRAP